MRLANQLPQMMEEGKRSLAIDAVLKKKPTKRAVSPHCRCMSPGAANEENSTLPA